MCRARYVSSATRLAECVAETLLSHWLTIRADDERQVTAWSGIEGFSQDWEHRDDRHDSAAGLLGLDPAHTFVNVLATVAHGIATAQAAVEQHVQPHPLTGADGPTLLILCDVLLGPWDESVARLPSRITDPGLWDRASRASPRRPT